MARAAARVAPLLVLAAGALQRLAAAQLLPLHKATAKLGYVAGSIFVGLLEEGFCTAEEEGDAEGGADGDGGKFQEAEGTVRAWPSL